MGHIGHKPFFGSRICGCIEHVHQTWASASPLVSAVTSCEAGSDDLPNRPSQKPTTRTKTKTKGMTGLIPTFLQILVIFSPNAFILIIPKKLMSY
jgi:hypothetical protein